MAGIIDNVFAFIDVLTGYQPAMLIMAAERLGVFGALADGPTTSEDMAARLDLDAGSLGALLRALAAIGMLVEADGRFEATPFVDRHLVAGRDLSLVIRKEEYFARGWLSIDEAVRGGRPVLQSWNSLLASDPATAALFLEALNVLAEHTGPQLWELAEVAPDRRVLDVGGGFGHYATRMAAAGSTVVLVDLPAVIDVVRSRMASTGSDVSVEFVAADVDVHPSCGVEAGSVDAALVSHMLHDRSEDRAIGLMQRVWRAIRPGGSVIVNDFAGDLGPGAFGTLFDVMMRVETGGAAHSLDRLVKMVESAGFEGVEVRDFPQPQTVITGTKAS